MNFRTLLFPLLLLGCNERTIIYTGKEMQLDFRGIKSFGDGDWIKIGDTKLIHSNNYEEQLKELILPASKSIYFINGRKKFEPNNPYYIALALGRNIDHNLDIADQSKIKIKDEKRFLLHISAILILTEKNGKEFSIEVPKNYPLKIEVLN